MELKMLKNSAYVLTCVLYARDLAMRLWGDVYYHEDTRSFKKKPPTGGGQRTFVQFLLEPLYKIYSTVLGEHPKSIERMLIEFDVHLKSSSYNMDVKPLLKEVCSTIFGTATGIALPNGMYCKLSCPLLYHSWQHVLLQMPNNTVCFDLPAEIPGFS